MATYQQIKNETINKSYDLDGYFNGTRINCGLTGYVQDFVTQKNTNGILNFMNEILQPGDICVGGPCAAAPYSHVALYDSDNGPNEVYFLVKWG